MSRIMIRSSCVLLALTAVLAWAGCRKEYARKEFDTASPQWAKVRSMIDTLRKADQDHLDEIMQMRAADGLDERQRSSLEASLMQIMQAETVELKQVTRFGQKVYRISLRLSSSGDAGMLFMLIVDKDGKLCWAGRN